MKQISEITKRDIFNLFIYGKNIDDIFENKQVTYQYYGKLSEIDFLKRLYDLKKLPSFDDRFIDAEGDIWQHTINNDDYDTGWVFEDERFELLKGEDAVILNFLCAVFHPEVRYEIGYWDEFLNEINGLLRKDGYELYPTGTISGKNIYGWREYNYPENSLFIPFSERHKKEIKEHVITLKLIRPLREQIYRLLERYNDLYTETTETGWRYNLSTDDYVFRDISEFYTPKCYNDNGQYVETDDMKKFILNTSPFCVFDVIELYRKHVTDDSYDKQINELLRLNSITYKLEHGRLESAFDIPFNKDDISRITEKGLKELLFESENYYRTGNLQIAVEKLWDSFERLKTFYSPTLNKAESAAKIINDMSSFEPNYKKVLEDEFKALTTIGNDFRIRHHETGKIDITDTRQYDYFYKRCFSLISVAILYLDKDDRK